MRIVLTSLLAVLAMGSAQSGAQIVVSSADGKQVRPGELASTRTADGVSIIDLRRDPPKLLATIPAPTSMIGAPTSVAVARSGGFALVTSAQRLNAAGNLEPNDLVSVIDLSRPSAPQIIQTARAGASASGVAINRAGTLALVAGKGDDSITVFAIAGKALREVGKVRLEAKAQPTDVTFAPSGATAMVVAQGLSKLIPLAISGTSVTVSGPGVSTGMQPYGAVYSPDGRFVFNTNLGGRPRAPDAPPAQGPRIGTVAVLDVAAGTATSVDVGVTPEHVALSPDGRYAAVVVANGTGAQPGPGDRAGGLLQVYDARNGRLTKITEVATAGWAQGAVFSDDGRTILLQAAATKTVDVFRFDGKRLIQQPAASLRFEARPGAIASPASR